MINTSLHLFLHDHGTISRLGKSRSILPARPPLVDSKKNHNTRPRHTRRIWHPLPPVDPKHPEGKYSELPRCRVNRPPPYCGGRHTPRSSSQSCVPSAPNACGNLGYSACLSCLPRHSLGAVRLFLGNPWGPRVLSCPSPGPEPVTQVTRAKKMGPDARRRVHMNGCCCGIRREVLPEKGR